MGNDLARQLEAAGLEVQYDAQCKKVLKQNVAAGNITAVDEGRIIELTQYLYNNIYGRYTKSG